MKPQIGHLNTIVTYVIEQKDVPDVGKLKAVVKISEKPIFNNNKSIDVIFISSGKNDTEPTHSYEFMHVGSSTISYKSIGAEEYHNRIAVNLILPSNSLRDRSRSYASSRNAAKKFLRTIITEYEKRSQ
ncbi:MAG: hypothetical protein WC916_07685 [Candidatus Woesearchaeota archaeon]